MSAVLDYQPIDQMDEEQFSAALADPMFRLSNLYWIKTKTESDDEGDEGLVVRFRPNRYQKRLLKKLHHRNIILKARQLGFCCDPATRVLTADLRWVPIGELQIGQEIVAVDEHAAGGRGSERKMRTATVQAAAKVHRKAYRITFDDGRSVTCTDQHPWLSKKAGTRAEWRSLSGKGNQVVGKLKVGTNVRWIAKPWSDERTFDDGWMGGMLDGEGSMAKPCSSGAEINVSQVQGPAFGRMEMYLSQRGYHYRTEEDQPVRKSKFGKTAVHKLCVSRMDEVFRLIGQTRPIRFLGRHFWEGKGLPGKRNGDVGWAKITHIEELGEQTMIDLQTSTGTYIAEGFVSHNTTLIQILFLDYALFTPNVRCGVIAHTDDAALKVFKKIKFAYDRLPDVLKAAVPLKTCNAHEMELANGSVLTVGTSMRSDTIHYLHISEFGKICAQFPHRAEEVITGTIPAVPNSGVIFIESTAEGRDGAFFKMSQRAEALMQQGKLLTPKEYRFHFFPWHEATEYQIDPAGVIISARDHEYFDNIEAKIGKAITPAQRAWWISTRDNDFAGEESKMWQEYPSTPEEAFQQSTAGTYYAVQIARARKEKRITTVPHMPGNPVNTFWDIGNGDGTAIWFHQRVGLQDRFIRFMEGWGEPYSYFVGEMQKLGYVWGSHYLPHDGNHVRQGEDESKSPKQMLESLGLRNVEIVPRVAELQHGIQAVRDAFASYWFDEEGCKEGLVHIEMYRKKWNAQTQNFTDQPVKHDGHSEAADALRQHAQGFRVSQGGNWKRKSTSWKAS